MHLISKIKIKAFMVILSVGFSSESYAAEVVNPGSSLGILSFVEKGGFMMYPIIFCSVLVAGIGLERAYNLRRKNIIDADFLIDSGRIGTGTIYNWGCSYVLLMTLR